MIKFFIGTVIGFIGGYMINNQGAKKELKSPSGESYSILYQQAQSENVKLRTDIKQKMEQIDELNSKIKLLTKTLRDKEDQADDRADDIEGLKRIIQKLRVENSAMQEQIDEYKMLYKSSQEEIENLKNK
ncbi:hypothetical protein [uncultured Bacteroides sp.]|uniref:hypothetical protein n=1 Tax=uncultured Bacteroides sp. TaxID=162156 RepID=UPI00261E249D|nr:hypothetical protein [uncultured Bacteroides sp.]